MSRADDPYLRQLQARYHKANRKEKSCILDEFVKTTGYCIVSTQRLFSTVGDNGSLVPFGDPGAPCTVLRKRMPWPC